MAHFWLLLLPVVLNYRQCLICGKAALVSAVAPRAMAAFVGGIIAMFGARLADGCPSGHGLSGGLQLAVSGYIALACFFIGGLISANLLYKGGGDK